MWSNWNLWPSVEEVLSLINSPLEQLLNRKTFCLVPSFSNSFVTEQGTSINIMRGWNNNSVREKPKRKQGQTQWALQNRLHGYYEQNSLLMSFQVSIKSQYLAKSIPFRILTSSGINCHALIKHRMQITSPGDDASSCFSFNKPLRKSTTAVM